MVTASILIRKQTHFVFWRPGQKLPAPKLIIGTFSAGPPTSLAGAMTINLVPSPLNVGLASPELWEIDASTCGLTDGVIYHYWFEVQAASPFADAQLILRVTDPMAYTVDWNLMSDPIPGFPAEPRNDGSARSPASVIRWVGGQLVPRDAGAVPPSFDTAADQAMATLPTNNRLVIYELPTAWTKSGDTVDGTNVGVGTFQDVLSLIRKSSPPATFATVSVLGGLTSGGIGGELVQLDVGGVDKSHPLHGAARDHAQDFLPQAQRTPAPPPGVD